MEKYCLFLNLSFILIDIIDKIPYWFLYELLRPIWDILYSDCPRKSWLSTLEQLIQEFLQLFQTIFPEQFIPKCHFLLHAARNTAKYGPLKRQMNLRSQSTIYLKKMHIDLEHLDIFQGKKTSRNKYKKKRKKILLV
jgi:hypothetical protein